MPEHTFTMELKVRFVDRDKYPELQKAFMHAARHVKTIADLIADDKKSVKIACYHEDGFITPEEIGLLDDIIQQGMEDIKSDGEAAPVSQELLDALKD